VSERFTYSYRHVKASIVVPAYNEEKLLAQTIASIRQSAEVFTKGGWSWELIVCDNNSTDSTAEVARETGAKIVFEPINQISRARNAGAAAAAGDWLIFIDADTLPSPAIFSRTRRIAESGQHLAVGANIQFETTVLWAHAFADGWNTISRRFHWAAGSYLAARTEAFRQLGGFSNELFVSEEIDLSIRLNREARRRQLEPLAVIEDALIKTSGRKLDLYSTREHLVFLWKTATSFSGAMREPEACHIWYDGRR